MEEIDIQNIYGIIKLLLIVFTKTVLTMYFL